MQEPKIIIDHEILNIVAEIDEFKGNWQLLKTLVPEHLNSLCKAATIESIGSSTRIEFIYWLSVIRKKLVNYFKK